MKNTGRYFCLRLVLPRFVHFSLRYCFSLNPRAKFMTNLKKARLLTYLMSCCFYLFLLLFCSSENVMFHWLDKSDNALMEVTWRGWLPFEISCLTIQLKWQNHVPYLVVSVLTLSQQQIISDMNYCWFSNMFFSILIVHVLV